MKKFSCTLLCLTVMVASALSSFGQSNSVVKEVLFLGNSYTNSNNLPSMVNRLANSNGDTLLFDANTPGGHRLMGHASNSTSLQKIVARSWDYVVLQAQSQEPSWSTPQVEAEVLPYAKTLSDTIKATGDCSEPMFYMTWGRENGDQANCPFVPWVCTYEGMDSALAANYLRMAQENKGLVSPVGAVWKKIRTDHPSIQLYTADGSHPSLAGSYVAACSFYASIFKKDPSACTWDGGLSPQVAEQIRMAASEVVYDELSDWSFVENKSVAAMGVQVNEAEVSVESTGSVYDSLTWNFGDGTIANQSSYTHTYSDSGDYQISLVAWKCGLSDTVQQTVKISIPADTVGDPTGIGNVAVDSEIQLFPNPASSQVMILTSSSIDKLYLRDALGRHIEPITVQQSSSQVLLQVEQLKPGYYFVQLVMENGIHETVRFVKL